LRELPEVGDILYAKTFDDVFRVEILDVDIDSNDAAVLLIDIGNTTRVPFGNLYEMTIEGFNIECPAMSYYLKDVNIPALNVNVIKFMVDLLKSQSELGIKSISENEIELVDKSNNVNVNQKIMKLGTFEEMKYDFACFSYKNPICMGPNIKLFVLNASFIDRNNSICCIDEKYLNDFREFYKSINAYGATVDLKSYGIPASNDFCLIKYNHQWHRGKIHKSSGDGKPMCILYDLAFICKVEVENIFSLPEMFHIRFSSHDYIIEGYETATEEKKMMIKNKFIENEFITVDEVDNVEDVGFVIRLHDKTLKEKKINRSLNAMPL
jgi:hypothetical protein